MTTSNNAAQTTRVSPTDADVLLTTERGHAFMVEATKLILAGRSAAAFQSEVIGVLQEWCRTRYDRVRDCYLGAPASRFLQVYIATKLPKVNFDLSDEVTDLQLEFHRQGWPVILHDLPSPTESELTAFFAPEESLQVFHAE